MYSLPVTISHRLPPVVAILRPRQWLKNAVVVAPLIFSRAFLHPAEVLQALASTLWFCLAASAAYIINDLADCGADRLHPLKRQVRPLAAGTMSTRAALRLLLGVSLLLTGGLWWQPEAAPPILLYLAIMALYSWRLKRVPGLDIVILVAGLVLRLEAGAAPIGVRLSFWIISTTVCLGVYVAALKRRAEFLSIGSKARSSLRGWSVRRLGAVAIAGGSASVVFYSLFVLTVRPVLFPTLLLAAAGMLRYAHVATKGWLGESPAEAVIADRPLLLILVAWGCYSTVALAR